MPSPGHDSGRVWHLGAGVHQIGSDPSCAVRLGSDQPGVVATVRVSLDASVRVRPIALREPPELDRVALSDAAADTEWPEARQLRIGDSRYEQAAVRQPDAMIEVSPEGEWLDYNRPPRLLPPEARTSFRLPAEPAPARPSPMPWITALLPAGLGLVMMAVMKNSSYLLMAFFSPVMMVGNWMNGRRTGKIGHRRMQAEYVEHLAVAELEIGHAIDAERLRLRASSPDAAELLLIATGPRSRLWERRRSDPDHLLVRVGLADLDSAVVVDQLDGPQRSSRHRIAHDAPAALSIAQAGVVGVAGRGEWPRRTARWLVGQIAVLQSPRDVQLYVLTDPAGDSLWDWATWLPHARPSLGQRALTLVGADAETLSHRVAELGDLIAARLRARLDSGAGAIRVDPDIVVVLDGALRLRALPGVVTVLREGPAVGVYSICVDADERHASRGVHHDPGRRHPRPPGHPAPAARRADRRDPRRRRERRLVSGGRPPPGAAARRQRSRRRRGPAGLGAAAGSAGHAGAEPGADQRTLGRPAAAAPRRSSAPPWTARSPSTWSPTVRTAWSPAPPARASPSCCRRMVASLAVANRPDEMNFVLVDYKGGAAFKDCVELPHTVGMVTDLDGHLVDAGARVASGPS